MWRLLMIALFSVCALGAVYVVFRFHKLSFVQRVARRSRLLAWLVSLLPLAAAACLLTVNLYTAAVALIHLILIWALCDLIGLLVRLCRKRRFSRYYAGYAALAFTALWLGIGWFNAHHVFTTRYTFFTDRLDAPLRVALVADSHLGITQDGVTFPRELERLQTQKPDLLVLAGDFVDDDTPREDMLAACRALADFDCPYGVYFVFGNHDKGYFHYRNFSTWELTEALKAAGVVILEDESVLADGRFYIVGRQDRSSWGRADMQTLIAPLDPEKFVLVLDHQPNAYAEEAAAGVDLVLSGHTHGGHLFPMGQIGVLMGANDRRYGAEKRENTQFVVTSGISGWAVPFKTGTASEVVLIDLLPQ